MTSKEQQFGGKVCSVYENVLSGWTVDRGSFPQGELDMLIDIIGRCTDSYWSYFATRWVLVPKRFWCLISLGGAKTDRMRTSFYAHC